MIQNRHQSQTDFRTPKIIFQNIQKKLDVKFTLDVAASKENALCKDYFCEKNSALDQDWVGHVWCNPPYNDIEPWVDKAIEQLKLITNSVTFLVPASTCTQWFEKLWDHPGAYMIAFVTARISFEGPHISEDGRAAAPNPSVVVHLTNDNYTIRGISRWERNDLLGQTTLDEWID